VGASKEGCVSARGESPRCEVCGTEKPTKYDCSGWNHSPKEQHGWRIVFWHKTGDDDEVGVIHEAEACRDVLRAKLDALGAP
jgi:hypothetical protein